MARLSLRRRMLEVGAGEGSVAAEMAERTGRRALALDLEAPAVVPAGVHFLRGDAARLPLADRCLDAVAFHFALLWMSDPGEVLREARRVLAPGGTVLFLSEPDLAARCDEPDTGLGRLLAEAVSRGGGDPSVTGRLENLCRSAGLRPALRWTSDEAVAVDDPDETAWEVRFLLSTAMLDEAAAASLTRVEAEAAASGFRRVRLPILYGTAAR